MLKALFTLAGICSLFFTPELFARDTASGFHLGVANDVGTLSDGTAEERFYVSQGELQFGFQAKNGFLIDGILQRSFWGQAEADGQDSPATERTQSAVVRLGWKFMHLRLLGGFQYGTVSRKETDTSKTGWTDNGVAYGHHGGLSFVLVYLPMFSLDLGVQMTDLRREGGDLDEELRPLRLTTAGVRMHLYPGELMRLKETGSPGKSRHALHSIYGGALLGQLVLDTIPRLLFMTMSSFSSL